MSLFFAVSLSNFRGEALARRSAKSATYYKNIFNSGKGNDIFEEVQSDHFHCQGRSGCLGAGQGTKSSLTEFEQWGDFGGASSHLIHLSVLAASGSLPLHFLAITTWICVFALGFHPGVHRGHQAGGSRSSWSFNCAFHVEMWGCQSSISLSAEQVMAWRGKNCPPEFFIVKQKSL